MRLAELPYTIDISENKSSGRTRRWIRGSSTSTPTHLHQLCQTTTFHQHLHNQITTSPIIHHHITTTSHLHHNSGQQTQKAHYPTTYSLHHGPGTTGPLLHPNTTKMPILANFSCPTKRSYPRQIPNHFFRGCYHKLVFQALTGMHLLLARTEREVPTQLPRVPSRARLKGRFSVVHSERERNTPQFLPMVFSDEGPSPRGVITQAIKALCAGPLHSHLVRERSKSVSKLYEQFAKFNKSEIQHFCKLEQQRKKFKARRSPNASPK
jgi:hypothetical protein